MAVNGLSQAHFRKSLPMYWGGNYVGKAPVFFKYPSYQKKEREEISRSAKIWARDFIRENKHACFRHYTHHKKSLAVCINGYIHVVGVFKVRKSWRKVEIRNVDVGPKSAKKPERV